MDALHQVLARLKTARMARDERGIAALEYALIAALIGIAISVGAATFGTSVSSYFTTLGGTVKSMSSTPGGGTK